MTTITAVRPGLHCLDLHFQGEPGVIASYLLESEGEYALIETGPSSTLPALLDGLTEIGVPMEAISKLLVTHVHLDHAGAAGTLIRRYPHLQLLVHEVGAPHMIDPTKLVSSATRIYGDRMESLWGDFEPVPPERLTALTDQSTVLVGSVTLEALYTPGHASHHVVYYHRERGEVFSGDVAAVRLQRFDYVRPPTPPPDIDLSAWVRSLHRLRDLHPDTLLLTHFGAFSDTAQHLAETERQLYAWAAIIEGELRAGQEVNAIKRALKEHADREVRALGSDSQGVDRYELASPSGMSVDGYLRYFRRLAR